MKGRLAVAPCLYLGDPAPVWGRGRGVECQGRENRRQVWKRMKGFHGNLCLPVAEVALRIPQASFPWTLKPASLAAESLTVERLECSTSGRERRERRGNQAALKMPLNPSCRLLLPTSGRDPPKSTFNPWLAFYAMGPRGIWKMGRCGLPSGSSR